jgi:hypothetical protein
VEVQLIFIALLFICFCSLTNLRQLEVILTQET